ncbi:MAG: hypothetical protein K2Y22_07335 [Candidatus Obscuribacterales bacterium]|nr:hypothetical protein [Candidatus Obscuribacterales bacterium]
MSAPICSPAPAYAAKFKEAKPIAPLPDENQAKILQIKQLLKTGKIQMAGTMIISVLESVTTVDECLNLANLTQTYGFPMMEVRRQCVRKALSLCRTSHDLMLVALTSRQYQFFELTRQAIKTLIDNTNADADLQNLAVNAQHLGLNDVAEMAMEKVYQQTTSPEEAIYFAQEVRTMGMEKLAHKSIANLITQEDNPVRLCVLLNSIESLNMHDVNRQLLKKALDNAESAADYNAIAKGAKKVNELDIANVADYRIRKMQLMQQIKEDQASYDQQVQDWQSKVDAERARREAEAARAKAAGDNPIVLPGLDPNLPNPANPDNIPGLIPNEKDNTPSFLKSPSTSF